jgi:outer membrane protein TolC
LSAYALPPSFRVVTRLPIGPGFLLRSGCIAIALLGGCLHVPPDPLAPARSADALTSRSLADPGLRVFAERSLGTTFPAWPPARIDLALATLASLYFQPSLDVARAQRDVARGAVETASQRPNPSIVVAPEWTSDAASGVSPWIALTQFDWPIETAHKRAHRIARADAQVAAAERMLDAEAEVAASDARCGALDARSAAEESLVALQDERMRAGAASRAETMPARLAWLATESERADAERSRVVARARLAAAIGIPANALTSIGVDYPVGSLDDPLDAIAEGAARRHALLERADVAAALDAYAATEAALRLELAKQWPDLHLGGGHQFDQGQNKWGVLLSLELPVMNRNEGPIAEAVAARAESGARFLALQAQIIAELDQAFAERDAARGQVVRFADLVREQRDVWKRAQTARAAGAVDRSTELTAEIELRRAEAALADARLALDRSRVQIEAGVQGPPPAPAGAIASSPRDESLGETP